MNSKKLVPLIVGLSIFYPLYSIAAPVTPALIQKQTTANSILGTLIVLNQNEISAANMALKKTDNKDVNNFALLMIKQHEDNLEKTELLSRKLNIQPIENHVATALKTDGAKELGSLGALHGSAFDKAYIEAMVKGHTSALNLVNQLINQSSNKLIKKHLEATKAHVEHHLALAERISKSLNK